MMDVHNPGELCPPVWPLPRAPATPCGISVDFSSSPYLDVPVQAVPLARLFDSTHDDIFLICRVPPFGNPRIKGYLLLPAAYRSLSRPSSAPDAKAFPLRSFQLDLFEMFGSHIVELCRQSFGSFFVYEIVTLHLSVLSTIKTIKTFCCLAYHFLLIVQFSRYNLGPNSARSVSAFQRKLRIASLPLLFLADPLSLGSARSRLLSDSF